MFELSFTIPLPPQAKGRPRHTKKGRTYTPKSTRDWETSAATVCRSAMDGDPTADLVEMTARFVAPRPRALMRKSAVDGLVWAQDAKDLDNYIKAVCDAANGIIWVDDRQVVRLTAEKVYAEKTGRPRVEVTVRTAGEYGQ